MVAATQINTLDPNALADLKRLSRNDKSPEALRATAKQFEGLFLQMVMKSMREATPSNGMLDNDQTRMFQGLQDQQMSMNMAQGRGVGLAKVIFRQLGGETLEKAASGGDASTSAAPRVPARTAILAARATPPASAADPALDMGAAFDAALRSRAARGDAPPNAANVAASAAATLPSDSAGGVAGRLRAVAAGTRDFVERVWSHAGEASRALGVPARFMVAQAALETGWGRSELRHADGRPSHNLFNIKAGPDWKGAVVEVPVTEYANGRPYKTSARFRAYGSYAEAFRDYAGLLRDSPRYAKVMGQTDASGFARSLQQAGYATDPMYADKLTRIISGNTLRTALAGEAGDKVA
jgi:flagellar protein FlgJ